MIWSLSILFTDVLNKGKSKVVKTVLKSWSPNVSTIVTASVILLTSVVIRAESILLSTICFIATAYVLSISLLLFEEKEWKNGRNLLTLLGVLGGAIMFYYALMGVIG